MKKRIVCMIVVFLVFISLPLFSEQEEAWEKEQPVIKETAGFWYAYMDFKGPYNLIGKNSGIFLRKFNKQRLKAKSVILVVYYNSPRENKAEDLEWACAFSIDKDAKVKPPLKKAEFKKCLSAVIVHRGPIEKIQQTNDKLDEHIEKNGFITVWPVYEEFFGNPMQVKIVHPVKKK